ncbi:MAG: septation protein IspZ [bacterium]
MSMALFGLLPLIVFAVVDLFAGMRAAILAAIIVAFAEAAWSWHQFGEIDNITWLSIGLIVAMGLVSIKMKDPVLFKFQPVVMALILAAVMAWFQWQGQPLMVQMMPKVAAMLPEEQRWTLNAPEIVENMRRLDLLMIPTFITHAAIVAWAALRRSTVFWLIARGVGFYVLLVMVSILNIFIPTK